MIYQEQLMEVARSLAGFSLGEADVLRKAVGKKIKSLLEAQREKLIEGMIKNGIKKEVAEKIWEWILPFASYGFNKSHSVAYAKIAFYTAYLKAHFPLEFMASLLSTEQADVERIGFLIEECKRMGIEVLPPDINESFRNFSVVPGKNQIRFGLLAIKNVGANTVEAIVHERKKNGPFNSLADFLLRIEPQNLNKKSLESMIKAGVFDRFGERNQLLFNLERILEWNKENYKMKNQGQMGLFDFWGKRKLEIKLEKTQPATKIQKLSWEKELLGLYVSSHPADDFRKIFEKKAIPISKITKEMAGRVIKVGGIISSVKRVITKNGSAMFFTKLEDGKDKIEVVFFPNVLNKKPVALKENKPIIVFGRVNEKDGIPKIICEDFEEIIES
jgi:DNA polymerase-3 subunit alpha